MNWQTSGDENGVHVSSVHDMIWYIHSGAHTQLRNNKRTYHFEWFIWSGCFLHLLLLFRLCFLFAFEKQIVITQFHAAFHVGVWCLSKKWKKHKEKNGPLEMCALARKNAITIEMYAQHCYNTHTHTRSAIGWLRWLWVCSVAVASISWFFLQ